MSYNTSYDVAALVLCLCCLLYHTLSNHIKKHQHTYFRMLILFLCAAAASNIASELFAEAGAAALAANPGEVPHSYILASEIFVSTYISSNILVVSTLTVYLRSLCGLTLKRNSPYYFLYDIPAFTAFLLMFLNLSGHFLFYYDDKCQYHRGDWLLAPNIITVVYVSVGIISLVKNRNFIRPRTLLYAFVGIGLAVTGFIVQVLFINLQVTCFAEAVVLVLFACIFENTELEINSDIGVYNRSAFLERMENLKAGKDRYILITVSLVNTRQLMSVLAPREKVLAIRTAAEELVKIAGRNNIYAYDREKFAVLIESASLRGVPHEDVVRLQEEITEAFEKPFDINNKTIKYNLLLTVVEDPEQIQGIEIESLFHRTRGLNYRKSNIVVRTEAEIKAMRTKADILAAIRRACEAKSFAVYYQPIWSVEKDRMVSAEALVRMEDPELGMVPPGKFIEIAEEYGLIAEIGSIVFEKVCAFCKTYCPERFGIEWIEINLSPYQLSDVNLVGNLRNTAARHHVPASYINLELTETAFTFGNGVFNDVLKELTKAGFSFSMDDYGTGYSNVTSLLKGKYKLVKIDKSLLWSATDSKGKDFYEKTITQLKAIGVQILQEGVESREQLDFVSQYGCKLIQGYYYSKPLSEKNFISYCGSRGVTSEEEAEARAEGGSDPEQMSDKY